MRHRSIRLLVCVAGLLALAHPAAALAQSGTRKPPSPHSRAGGSATRLLAEPARPPANPYRPKDNHEVRLPVALKGYCAVSMRDGQQWIPGQKVFQLVFDGQLYWFAGERRHAMFAAAPHRYVPVLAGNCVVTYEKTGEREPGKIEYGLLAFFGETADLYAAFGQEQHTIGLIRRQIDRRAAGIFAQAATRF